MFCKKDRLLLTKVAENISALLEILKKAEQKEWQSKWKEKKIDRSIVQAPVLKEVKPHMPTRAEIYCGMREFLAVYKAYKDFDSACEVSGVSASRIHNWRSRYPLFKQQMESIKKSFTL